MRWPSSVRLSAVLIVPLLAAGPPVLHAQEVGSNDLRISDMGPNGDPAYDAGEPAVAFGWADLAFLVVWSGDDTSGGLAADELEIFGELRSATGGQIGSSDVRISYAGGTGDPAFDAFAPDLAYNSQADDWLVVWTQDTDDGDLVDGEYEIWGQVLDADLTPLYGGNFRISTMGPDGAPLFEADEAAAAYDSLSNTYLVVWQGSDDAGDLDFDELEIWAQRLSASGAPIGGNFRISDMGTDGDGLIDAYTPDVAFNSLEGEYLIVWAGDDDSGSLVDNEFEIYAQRIDQTGGGVGTNDARVSDAGGTGNSTYTATRPAVAFNPHANQYLVVWWGDDNVGGLVDNELEIFGQRMTWALAGLGPNDFRISDAGDTGSSGYQVKSPPGVAFNLLNDEYLVVWSGEDTVDGMVNEETEVFFEELSAEGAAIASNDLRISDAGGLGDDTYRTDDPAVAAHIGNGQFLVAWAGDDDTGTLVDDETEIFIQRLQGSLVFADGFEGADSTRWDDQVP